MPSHTDLERAKQRLDLSRPIKSFFGVSKGFEVDRRKEINELANPRSRPIINKKKTIPAPSPSTIRGNGKKKISDIPSGISEIRRLNEQRKLRLQRTQ